MINKKNDKGWSALMLASCYSNTASSIEVVRLLLEFSSNVNLQNRDGWTALMMGSLNSNTESSIETVKLLLEYKADVNLQNKNGETVLTILSRANTLSIETIPLLKEYGAKHETKFHELHIIGCVILLSIWTYLGDTI